MSIWVSQLTNYPPLYSSNMRNYAISELCYRLPVSLSELNIDKILASGQVFRWRKSGETWFGVTGSRLFVLRQDSTAVHYTWHDMGDSNKGEGSKEDPISKEEEVREQLSDFFNLNIKVSELTGAWSTDRHLTSLLGEHAGLRLIRNDPYECLISFITSACNNIPRISSLLLALSSLSEASHSISNTTFHPLPPISIFSLPGMEDRLRKLGFGYRAKYLVSALTEVQERGGRDWLMGLREKSLADARMELCSLAGVGPKVASCVCLMSLDKHDAVPIDTHIHQVNIFTLILSYPWLPSRVSSYSLVTNYLLLRSYPG